LRERVHAGVHDLRAPAAAGGAADRRPLGGVRRALDAPAGRRVRRAEGRQGPREGLRRAAVLPSRARARRRALAARHRGRLVSRRGGAARMSDMLDHRVTTLLAGHTPVVGHKPWPRYEVDAATWDAIGAALAREGVLLGLWGEADAVHLALMTPTLDA